MQVELAYGRRGLTIAVPDDATVLRPKETPGVPDETEAIRAALRAPIGSAPLRERVHPDDTVVVVFSDLTRPMPNDRVLPVLLDELSHVPREQILLLNATGTHRSQTREELMEMLGEEIVRGYRIAQHDAFAASNLVEVGVTSFGHRALISRLYLSATVRILTGFIEPHIFAGFSGGPKAVLPGVAGIETIMENHSYGMMRDPRATWGVTEGNPVWEEMREAARMARPTFLLNVTINRHRQITGVFAGEMEAAHAKGVALVRSVAMTPVAAPFDVVITTNSGYPLDINLYQAAKGMSAAAQIVKQGGSILIASECAEGIPEYGEYKKLIHEGGSVQGVLDLVSQPGFRRHDMWEALLQAGIQQQAEVHVYAGGLTPDETRGMLFEPCTDVQATLRALLQKHGPQARLCVLPEGPQTIPYLRG
jgi:nickel-dependent lactate racemase